MRTDTILAALAQGRGHDGTPPTPSCLRPWAGSSTTRSALLRTKVARDVAGLPAATGAARAAGCAAAYQAVTLVTPRRAHAAQFRTDMTLDALAQGRGHGGTPPTPSCPRPWASRRGRAGR
ncbi:hypothetical protein GCM10027212_11110 [Actinotalea caeni]